jgi:predicted porin
MKKTLIAAAVLSMTGAAFAQTNIVLGGNFDVGYAAGRGSTANLNALSTNRVSSSNVHIRGTEDMAGGLKAGFWLEADFAADSGAGAATNNNNQAILPTAAQAVAPAVAPVGATGAPALNARNQGLTFNRRATGSIAGSWGEVRLGRDYTPHFWTLTGLDPFGTNGVGASAAQGVRGCSATPCSAGGGTTAVRASNSIAYGYGYALNGNMITGTGGLYGTVMYFMGENASNTPTAANPGSKDDGGGSSFRVGYAGKNWNVVAASGSTNLAAGDWKTTNFGGSYNFGVANVMAYINTDEAAGGVDHKGMLIGVTAPLGAHMIRGSYSTHERDTAGGVKVGQIALGYVHILSKRTSLYGTYARVDNSNGASYALNGSTTAANQSSSGFDLGIRHQF